jgi:division protein CdvB (Snf7/Vps24/ESCRT-III family)
MKNFLHHDPPPIRETVATSIMTLKVQHNKINQATYRLKERDKILFESCMMALKNKNKARATICAGEVSEVRKLLQFLHSVELAIERVILRLETIKELSDIVADLKPALKLLQNVSQELFNVLPDVSSELTKVNETIRETLSTTRINADESIIPVNTKTPGGEEVLGEVSEFLKSKVSKDLPEPPANVQIPEDEKTALKEMVALAASCSESLGRKSGDSDEPSQTLFSFKKAEIKEFSLKVEKPQLEDVLFEYVKKTKGQIDMQKCSTDLDAPHEEVERALKTLGAKGKIKIEVQG